MYRPAHDCGCFNIHIFTIAHGGNYSVDFFLRLKNFKTYCGFWTIPGYTTKMIFLKKKKEEEEEEEFGCGHLDN